MKASTWTETGNNIGLDSNHHEEIFGPSDLAGEEKIIDFTDYS